MRRIIYHIIILTVFVSAVLPATAQQRLNLSQSECRSMALAHSEDLQRADNSIRQAELDKAVAFAAYLPKIDGNLTGAYLSDMDMMGIKLQMHGMYMAGITLTQPIYAGGKIRAGNRLAEIGRQCAEEERNLTRMQVIADADNAYWSYIAVIWKVKMLDSYRQQMDSLYSQTSLSVDAGMSTGSELLRIDTRRSEVEYQLQKARNGANLCRLSLCNIIGCPFESDIVPVDTVIVLNTPEYLDESIAMRPELHLLQKQIEAAEQQVKVSRADILPQIGLSAGYTYYGNMRMKGFTTDSQGLQIPYSQNLHDGMALAMLSVKIPIFHWGEGLKKIKKAKIEVRNRELELEKNTRLMNIEVRQAILNVMDSHALARTAELGCIQANENLHEMQNRYECGMCSLIDLMDAQTQWQQARSNRIEALTQCKITETEYLRVTGRIGD